MKLPFVTRAKYDKDMKQVQSHIYTLIKRIDMLQSRVEFLYNERHK